jgi:plasmid stability protein
MPVQITIRNVPESVRDELAARAANERKSMQEFLLGALEGIASRPSAATWLEQVRLRKRVTGTKISAKEILEHRDADRR